MRVQFGKLMRGMLLFAVVLLFFWGCQQHTSPKSLPGEQERMQLSPETEPAVSAASGVQSKQKMTVRREQIYSFTLHYPGKLERQYPLILFIPGWGSRNYEDYLTLIDFLVMKGNIVLFAPEYANEYGSRNIREEFEDMYRLCFIQKYMDTSRFGVLGHSSGGGKAFSICRYFWQKGWGKNGRFIFAMAPWFAFDMGKKEMQSLPSDTYMMIELFGNDMTTDLRIPMTIYSLLTSIPDDHKTFYIYPGTGHGYPVGRKAVSQMKGVIEPLEALMDATFRHQSASFAEFDKEGSDTPWQAYRDMAAPSQSYPSGCRPPSGEPLSRAIAAYDIDYCEIF